MSTTPTATLYYITYPFVLLSSLLLTIAAPLVHLAHYVVYGLWWWPLGVLAKFETLYIFFGVATLVGVLVGTALHFFSGFLIAALSLEAPQPSSSFLSTELLQQQQQRQRRPKTPAEIREGRRRGEGWDEVENGILKRTEKGIKEEENRDDERVWQERVEGASRRADRLQEGRAATAVAMAAGGGGGGKGKKKDSYGDWSGRRQSERDHGKERGGERGRKGVMTSTIPEESSSEVGF